MNTLTDILGRIWASRQIVDDFEALCGFEGRFAGTRGEQQAVDYLAMRLEQMQAGPVRRESVAYRGWDREESHLIFGDGRKVDICALGRSPNTPDGGLTAEVIDIGRGTPDDFERVKSGIVGRIVLVRHEFMQTAGHIHRRRKYEMAKAAGAVGFLIACHLPGGLLVTGSTGTGEGGDIPSAGITYETGLTLEQYNGPVRLNINGTFRPREATNLFLDIPGQTPEWVVISAHIDGHHLADSAIDNASGLACALAIADAMKDEVRQHRRGLRIALFNVEEWAMIGSREHLARLSPSDKQALAFNINLDAVAGSSRLGVMTSGIACSGALLERVNAAHGFSLPELRPFMNNSDHANFILAGIPAIRLLAGVEDPTSHHRYLLTGGDTKDKVRPTELKAAAAVGAAFVMDALDAEFSQLTPDEIEQITRQVPTAA